MSAADSLANILSSAATTDDGDWIADETLAVLARQFGAAPGASVRYLADRRDLDPHFVMLANEVTPAGPAGTVSPRIARHFETDGAVGSFFAATEMSADTRSQFDSVGDLANRVAVRDRSGFIIVLAASELRSTIETLAAGWMLSPQILVSRHHVYVTDIDWGHGIFFGAAEPRSPMGTAAVALEEVGPAIPDSLTLAEFGRRSFYGLPIAF